MPLPINPRPQLKKQISLRLSYSAIDMLHYLKTQSGLPQEAVVERLIVDAVKEMESRRGAAPRPVSNGKTRSYPRKKGDKADID